MRVKPRAVVGISQSFQTSDVIARYTGVINRQIKTHQRDHGCLKLPRQIIKEQIFVPHHIFHGATYVLASGIQALSGVAHMRDVLGLRHVASYGHVRRHCPLPSNISVQLLSLTTLFTQRGVGRVFVFSTVFLDIPTLAVRRLTFQLWRFKCAMKLGLFEYISFVARIRLMSLVPFLFEYIHHYCI